MNKNDNALQKWWFTFILIPVVVSSIIITHKFGRIEHWSQMTYSIMQWLIVFSTAMVVQTYLIISNRVKYKAEHYTYIGFSILITIFVGFILSTFVFDGEGWKNMTYSTLISFAVLFVFKYLLWWALHTKSDKSHKKDEKLNKLEQENEMLKTQITELKGEEQGCDRPKRWWRR